MGARIVSVPATGDYSFPVDAVLSAVTPNTRLVYVNNPNNPTGQPVPQAAIRRVAREAGHAIVFVDEAYHDFMTRELPRRSGVTHPNVIVGRTFSKALRPRRHAGGRADCRRPPCWSRSAVPCRCSISTSSPSPRCARPSRTRSFRAWYLEQAGASKEMVYAACERLGLRYWKSAANFVLIDGGDARQRRSSRALIARGVFVRDRSSDPSCPNCFRLTAGVIEHTRQAVEALEAVCGGR